MVKSKVFTLCNLLMYVFLLGISFSSFAISSNDKSKLAKKTLAFRTAITTVNNDIVYNPLKMKQDIKKYGLFNSEDVKDCFIEEQFELFNIKYFKVAVGKKI